MYVCKCVRTSHSDSKNAVMHAIDWMQWRREVRGWHQGAIMVPSCLSALNHANWGMDLENDNEVGEMEAADT